MKVRRSTLHVHLANKHYLKHWRWVECYLCVLECVCVCVWGNQPHLSCLRMRKNGRQSLGLKQSSARERVSHGGGFLPSRKMPNIFCSQCVPISVWETSQTFHLDPLWTYVSKTQNSGGIAVNNRSHPSTPSIFTHMETKKKHELLNAAN